MGRALDFLVDLLTVESIEVNIFRGVSPDEDRQRVFGGQVAGQALMAAARTVSADDGRSLHSLHGYFLRPGDVRAPILYEVERARDGRSFTTRRVTAIQHGKAIFVMAASWHAPESSFEHQRTMPADTPPPESLPTWKERWAPYKDQLGDWYERPRPIDMRQCDSPPPPGRTEPAEPRQRVWLKADGQLPDDPILHACIVAWASDMTLLDTSVLPHGGLYNVEDLMMASLDHAMWFHRPFRIDDWMLYDQESPTASSGRGFAWGHIYTATGDLAVSVVQEGLLRLVR